MKGVVILYETLHAVRKSRMNLSLKYILKRFMIRLNGVFLQRTLRMIGFSQKMVCLVAEVHAGGNVNIKVNSQLGSTSRQKKKAYDKVLPCRQYYLI
jgi:hypothetical protein